MKTRNILLAVGLFALVAGIAVFGPGETDALPSVETDIIWLDANGNEVGTYFRGCDGQRITTGTQSAYKIRNVTPCTSGTGSSGCYINASPADCNSLPFRCIFFRDGLYCS
ncbi:MAG: DUF6289 family protein [Acidobacteriota bacterium]